MALIHTLVLPLVAVLSISAGPGWLGVQLAQSERPTIGEVVPNSPAAKAGMKSGDVFVSINGTRVRSVESLASNFRKLSAGDRVKFVMRRGRKEMEFRVRLGERPIEGREPVRVGDTPKKDRKKVGKRDPRPGFLGIEIEETDDGIVVTSLVAGGPGGRSGVRRGDRIRSFNGKRVRSIDDLDKIMKDVRARDRVRMSVSRRDTKVDIAFTAAARPGAKPLAEAKGRDRRSDPTKRVAKKPAKKAAKKPAKKSAKKPAKEVAKKPAKEVAKKPAKEVAKAPQKRGTARKSDATGKALSFSDSLEKSLAAARRSGRPVMVVFGASWCVNCQTLKKSLRHSSLQGMLGRYERVWIDTDQQSALADKYKVESLPHTVFLTSRGKLRAKILGYQPPQILAPLLRKGLSGGDVPKKATGKTRPTRPTRRDAAAKTPARRGAPKKEGARATDVPSRRLPRAVAARNREAAMASELKALRSELRRLRTEQRQQRELLNRILRELQKKK